jgi:hypothetical protein
MVMEGKMRISKAYVSSCAIIFAVFCSNNLQAQSRKSESTELARQAIENNPDLAQRLYADYIRSIGLALEQLAVAMRDSKKDLISTFDEKISWTLNHTLSAADQKVLHSLHQLQSHLMTSEAQALTSFQKRKSDFIFFYNSYLEAKIERMPTVEDWAKCIEESVDSFIKISDFGGLSHELLRKASQIFAKEKSIGIQRAWLNRETISVGAMAALLAAQGVCVVVTVGICSATLPATSSWVVTGGRIALGAARTTVVSMSAANLVDRYRFEGAAGLINVGSAIDTLIIVSSLPGPTLAALESARTFEIFGKTINASDVAAKMARLQFKTTTTLSAAGAAYGGWEVMNAEAIANHLNEKGEDISASDIRRQGVMDLAMSGLGGLSAYHYFKTTLKNSPKFQAYQDAHNTSWKSYAESFSRFGPKKSFGNIYNGLRLMRTNFKSGTKLTAVGLGYLTYQAAVSGALSLASYTYPDFVMRAANPSLPELREGESALLLNGFASNDLLYYAFSSDYANRFEIKKYGKHLGASFFESSDDLFQKIKDYAAKNGKIRYLKIMAHGVPGRIVPLATQDVMDGSRRELLDVEYLQRNEERIKQLSGDAMAPDAEVVIISCLVGGNLNKAVDYRGLHFEEKSGDRFIQTLGDTLLVNGGAIESSRRIIMGLDGSIGPLWDHAMFSAMQTPQEQLAFDREIEKLKRHLDDYNFAAGEVERKPKRSIFEGQKDPEMTSIVQSTGERLVRMYSHIWAIAYKFGYNGEGGMFMSRHRHDEFPKQARLEE